MGRLKIEKIFYEGDNYYFESPSFDDGINIIEGLNGSGKSTFSNLISFSLGNYVKEFDKKKNKTHTEIVSDTNNYVLALISIDKEQYKIKRFFNDNKIFVEKKEEIQDYLINRPTNETRIFSDWLLETLGIPVVEFYQGTAKSKLNFSDLFRLIYYDQKTSPAKIYKEAKTDGNFISDSEFIRKVIFQILLGHEFSEYYRLIGELNKAKKDKSKYKSKEEGFKEIASEFGFNDLINKSFQDIKDEITKIKLQTHRLEVYEQEILNGYKDQPKSVEKTIQLKNRLIDKETSIENALYKRNRIYKEIQNIKTVMTNTILEVTQIKKIILTHEKLNLFSPDTCPYCLNRVHRREGHCICGKEISESEYEKFFYSSDEYLIILKSKQKSLDTLNLAIESCEEELNSIEEEISQFKEEKKETELFLLEVKEDVERRTNLVEIKDIQQKKHLLREKLTFLEQNYSLKEKYDEIEKSLLIRDELIKTINSNLSRQGRKANQEIESQVASFNKIYNDLLIDIKEDIKKAQISIENYMPIINNGEYKEASVDVPIRLMYFLTLLKMSVKDSEIPFPRFLLIDTPESLGIDKSSFEKTLSKFTLDNGSTFTNDEQNLNFQIILTTGLEKYPEEFAAYKKGRSLNKSNKLLIKK